MSDQPVLSKPPAAAEIRAELEAMVVGDLLGPAGGEIAQKGLFDE